MNSWINHLFDPEMWEQYVDDFHRSGNLIHSVYSGRKVHMHLNKHDSVLPLIEFDRCYLKLSPDPVFTGHQIIIHRNPGTVTRFHSIEISIPVFTLYKKEGVITLQSILWTIMTDLKKPKPVITTAKRLSEEDRLEARKTLLDIVPLADDPYEKIDPVWLFMMNERYCA